MSPPNTSLTFPARRNISPLIVTCMTPSQAFCCVVELWEWRKEGPVLTEAGCWGQACRHRAVGWEVRCPPLHSHCMHLHCDLGTAGLSLSHSEILEVQTASPSLCLPLSLPFFPHVSGIDLGGVTQGLFVEFLNSLSILIYFKCDPAFNLLLGIFHLS